MVARPASRIVRAAPSDMQLDQLAGRVLFPTPEHGPWLPYERFAEVTASRPNAPFLHPHRLEEVVNYVLSGRVAHQDGEDGRTEVEGGSVILLSTRSERSHDVFPVGGKEAHWIAIDVQLPRTGEETESTLQIVSLPAPRPLQDGVLLRPVVGPLSPANSARGLEVTHLEFTGTEEVSLTRPCGLGRREVAYVLSGSGTVDGLEVSAGSGVLTEDVARVEVRGSPGLQLLLATAPGRLR